jgi:hypothetical protein
VANSFVHIELSTGDVERAKAFYGSLFDWKQQDMPMGDGQTYTLIDAGEDNTGGGMMKSPMPGAPPMWLAYVGVDDLDASTNKAKELGATVLKEKTEVPGMGWFSVLTDPTGAMFAMWQPTPR